MEAYDFFRGVLWSYHMMPKQQLSDCKAPQAEDDRQEAGDLSWGTVAIRYAEVDHRDSARVVDAWDC